MSWAASPPAQVAGLLLAQLLDVLTGGVQDLHTFFGQQPQHAVDGLRWQVVLLERGGDVSHGDAAAFSPGSDEFRHLISR